MERDDKGTKKSGLSSYVFVGCLIIGFGLGLIAMGTACYKTGKW
jgi:hypothetical protein